MSTMQQEQQAKFHTSVIDLENGPEQFRQIIEFIKGPEVGLRLFTPEELNAISGRYAQDLKDGIDKNGKSSLAMYDTFLPTVDVDVLPEGREATVIVVGGTKLRAGNVIKKDGKLQVLGSYEKEIGTIVFENTDAFCSHVIDTLHPFLLKNKSPSAFSLVWAFPGTAVQLPENKGVDVNPPAQLTKGYIIPGIEEQLIGTSFLKHLQKQYRWGEIPLAVMNDTRAVEGGILGTGFNLAMGRYNSESGGFDKVYANLEDRPVVDKEVDEQSENPGKQLAEKMISGKYLGRIVENVVKKLEEKGLLAQKVTNNTAEFISKVLQGKVDQKLRMEYQDPYLYATLMHITNIIATRSAQLTGVMTGTMIEVFPEEFPGEKIDRKMEGSVFWGIPGFKQKAEEYANYYANMVGKNITFIHVPDVEIIGAAAAALSQIPKNN